MFFTPKRHFQKSHNVSMFYVVGYWKQQKKKTQSPRGTELLSN